jgi:murein DD-endopeptidase MepM/ murein hydrolase activator NlpD
MLGAGLGWTTGWRHGGTAEEMRWLRVRLAEKQELIARQRLEMAEVAAAVDHLARTTSAVGDRAEQARRLAHMEESRDASSDLLHLTSFAETGGAIVSEDAARTLEQLAWLEGETTSVGDSIAVLTALLKDRPMIASKGAPSLWPVRGLVTSSFGMRSSPYGGSRELHPGIDIQARYGMPVTAGGDGKVIFAGRDPGYGGLVVIDHGGEVDTFYAHLSALYVREGQNIRRGQPLGAVGASGRATGAHLHYEVRVHGTPVDPHRYLVN